MTSGLSPHLHFGEISARQVFHVCASQMDEAAQKVRGGDSFLREVGWREFCAEILMRNPHLPDEPLSERFTAFPWRDDPEALKAWQRGRTGYPLVDAGMRQLWHTGWMHNRVRMITASFLIKHLLLPWQLGEQWFWDTLVDADLANNAGGWQWVAGCGVDAAPYFRIFNPIIQGEKFDPEGAYVRRWVPELANLPARWIHKPWQASPLELEAAGVRLGATYPHPIVDHSEGRARALAAFETIKT
jgi:deoxyribodipyrimidine photo-lyase